MQRAPVTSVWLQAHAALVHHERRLHQRMLADELRAYEREGDGVRVSHSSGASTSSQLDDGMSLDGRDAATPPPEALEDPFQVRSTSCRVSSCAALDIHCASVRAHQPVAAQRAAAAPRRGAPCSRTSR